MKLPRLSPDTAYIGASLFLPLSKVSEGPIRGALTFGLGKDNEPRVLVKNHPTHLEVPRGFLTPQQLQEDLGLEVVDLRPKKFPRSSLRPKPGFALRDRQLEPWTAFKDSKGSVLHLPCGAGKTVMGLYKAAHEGLATLIVSPQAAHLDNWLSEMQQFFDLDSEPGRVGDGKMEYDREVVLCTVQTLATRAEDGKLPIDFAHRFGTIIFDECHHMSAEWFARSIDLCIGNRYGLTATPKRTDRNEGVFLSHIGPIVYSDDTQEMIPEIEVIELDTELTDADEKLIQDRSKQRNLAMLKSWLAQNTERNAAISRRLTEAVAEGRTIYALSHSVEHVKTLSAMFPGSGLITGETPSEDRLKELNKSKIVFATFGVATENYNRKDLDCLFILTPLAADGYAEAPQLRQAIGRVQRAAQGKKTPEVVIFLDRNIDECKGLTYSVLNYLKSKNYPFRNSTWNQKRRSPMGRT